MCTDDTTLLLSGPDINILDSKLTENVNNLDVVQTQ